MWINDHGYGIISMYGFNRSEKSYLRQKICMICTEESSN